MNVKHEPLFIFLLRDGAFLSFELQFNFSCPTFLEGTVISIHPSTLDYTSPIAERLTQPDSVLRTSEDASLLVQSLLDLGFRPTTVLHRFPKSHCLFFL